MSDKTISEKIRQKKHAIAMYKYDVWGGSAWGNVQTIKKLEIEISNLKLYGKEYPTMWQKFRTAIKKRGSDDK